METGAEHYSFLVADEEIQFTTLFCNYLALGQFELARATLHQLATVNPQKVYTLLAYLLNNGIPEEW